MNGHTKIVKLLLEAGADVNAKSKYGTALTLASLWDRTEVVKILIEAGADINATDSESGT